MAQIAPGWYTDPTRTYSYRYWDGQNWTNQVSSGGTSGSDPNPLDPTIAATPPAPGSEAQTTAPAPPTQPTVQVSQSSGGSSFGTIIGVILAIIVVVVLIAVIASSSGDDTSTTDAPTQTTEAPTETTAAP